MFPLVLAAVSAGVWGTADYVGGRATRRIDAFRVAVLSKLFSVPLLAVYLTLLPVAFPGRSVAWGLAAGGAGMAALITFYRALASGAMAVVAPVSAVTAAVLPFGAGLVAGERPGLWAIVGVLCAVAAIGLVSMAPSTGRATMSLVGLALLSGVGFGLFFVLLDRAAAAAGGDAGLWPIAFSQSGALLVGFFLWERHRRAAGRTPSQRPAGILKLIALSGMLDMTANALYLLAVRDGMLSIVAPLASLYPVSTVLLALALDRERVRPVQVAGLGLAVAALVLVAS
ncbi:membrane protein [Virgisporangium aliadipatigenens]|uniref:Membrane protein n=1 Tax=Virgisporangium aliadipatigenens TaxID=741659 RepID=A0A8J3YSN4_9ACTN|nr:EamA family transporter [Virgisporangium aliadipatigenens]GIJ49698.1 membrane protein [Virgisporangium aliadipatigenens]